MTKIQYCDMMKISYNYISLMKFSSPKKYQYIKSLNNDLVKATKQYIEECKIIIEKMQNLLNRYINKSDYGRYANSLGFGSKKNLAALYNTDEKICFISRSEDKEYLTIPYNVIERYKKILEKA